MADQSPSRFAFLMVGLAAAGAVVQIVLICLTAVPLGVPGEWVWSRHAEPLSLFDLLPVCLTGTAFTGYIFWAARRVALVPPAGRAALLLGLWLLGCCWIWGLVSALPVVAGAGRVPFVLYYERSSGYFWQARYQVDDLGEFLRTYEQRIADSDKSENYLHLGTHPPGLTSLFVGLIRLCEWSPALTRGLTATQPLPVREAFQVIQENELRSGRNLRDVDMAAMWLAALLVLGGTVATCGPLFCLAGRGGDLVAAWWTAAFWVLVPVMAIFLPKSDVVFPCFAMLAQWQWLTSLDQRSAGWGAAAGFTMLAAVCLSLAFVPVGLILVLQFLCCEGGGSRDKQRVANQAEASWGSRRSWKTLFAAASAFLAPVAVLWFSVGLRLPWIWMQNLANHAAFYRHHTRSSLPWLGEIPLELAMSLGIPLALLAVAGGWGLLARTATDAQDMAGKVFSRRRLEWGIPVVVWLLLWLSGKNRGEAARLWIFLMPYAVLLATPALEKMFREPRGRGSVLAVWLLQMGVAAATALHVDGFHLSELLGS